MSIVVRGKIVLVVEVKQDNTTASGIILEGNDNTRLGKVVGVGPDVKNIIEGDKVVVIWGKGHILKMPGQQYVMINDEDVLAVIQ